MTGSDTTSIISVTLLGTNDTFGPIVLKAGFAQNEEDTFILRVPEIGLVYGLTFTNSNPSDSWILGNATLETFDASLILTFGYNIVVTTPVAMKANEVDCYSLSLQTENSITGASAAQFYVNITGEAGTSLYFTVPRGISAGQLVTVPLIATMTTGTPYTVNLLNMDSRDAWAITTGNLTVLDNLFNPSTVYRLPSVIARTTAYLQLPFNVTVTTGSGATDGTVGNMHIRFMDATGYNFTTTLGMGFKKSSVHHFTMSGGNLLSVAGVELGSFSTDTWHCASVAIYQRGTTQVFTGFETIAHNTTTVLLY